MRFSEEQGSMLIISAEATQGRASRAQGNGAESSWGRPGARQRLCNHQQLAGPMDGIICSTMFSQLSQMLITIVAV